MASEEQVTFKNDPKEEASHFLGKFDVAFPDWRKRGDPEKHQEQIQKQIDEEANMDLILIDLQSELKSPVLAATLSSLLVEDKLNLSDRWGEDAKEVSRSMLRMAAEMDRGVWRAFDIHKSQGMNTIEGEEAWELSIFLSRLEQKSSPSELPIT